MNHSSIIILGKIRILELTDISIKIKSIENSINTYNEVGNFFSNQRIL